MRKVRGAGCGVRGGRVCTLRAGGACARGSRSRPVQWPAKVGTVTHQDFAVLLLPHDEQCCALGKLDVIRLEVLDGAELLDLDSCSAGCEPALVLATPRVRWNRPTKGRGEGGARPVAHARGGVCSTPERHTHACPRRVGGQAPQAVPRSVPRPSWVGVGQRHGCSP